MKLWDLSSLLNFMITLKRAKIAYEKVSGPLTR